MYVCECMYVCMHVHKCVCLCDTEMYVIYRDKCIDKGVYVYKQGYRDKCIDIETNAKTYKIQNLIVYVKVHAYISLFI